MQSQNKQERVYAMLKSMTGFGRFEAVSEERKLVVEIKSVNHRYSDISIRLPKKLSFLETAVRNKLKEYISRGKVLVTRIIPKEKFVLSITKN